MEIGQKSIQISYKIFEIKKSTIIWYSSMNQYTIQILLMFVSHEQLNGLKSKIQDNVCKMSISCYKEIKISRQKQND
ncbi:hypothetical protein COE98_13390 [Bacillus wiedmannii]|nr:hypothetical protein COE98_13390 [Bacillus wiedmannii]